MLDLVFMFCAGVGGVIMVIQFALMLLGVGDDLDGGNLDADFDGGIDGDFDADVDIDADHPNTVSDAADADFDHPDSVWVFQVLSVRGIIAAITFFGLGGWWARAGDMAPTSAVALGAVLGLFALYAMYWAMKQLYKLRASGTVNIANARGREATIYVPVPAAGDGRGKVHLMLQGRTMEYEAVTDEPERLATGEPVVVTDVLGGDLVQVARAHKTASQTTQASA
ncbi:hypothetical protein Pla123a_36590 [Posidoniimonas polymericola]|uniref:NfeD-like C-terminal domain-containing protein n=1 Tax=Posidoniimonas polymericola TaxID=2528002 RepID=A0A5C5YGZ4_9BACT|nr:NfeD family protein [Posidoniimonas polymericola]TWT73765.1 hypothetical protein Pla123a_36590 [Posidoniimonas polymericola]